MTGTASFVVTIRNATTITTTSTTVGKILLSSSKGQEATSTFSRRYRKQQAAVPVDLRVILRWTVSSVYRELGQLDPVPFWKGFCQLLRCHYLLWQAGDIAKPEIFPPNLLYDDLPERKTAVLIDFDVAVGSEAIAPRSDSAVTAKEQSEPTTEVDSTSKSKPAERMPGALIFMPHEIVIAPQNPISRKYRHDLESFTWYLTWQCFSPQQREDFLKKYERWFEFDDLATLREQRWFGRPGIYNSGGRYWHTRYPYSDIPFDKGKWGYRMQLLVRRLLVFWTEDVPRAIKLGRLGKELTKGGASGESRKDPFAEIASGPVFGDWKNEEEEEEMKWIAEKFGLILREIGFPLGFEFADLDSTNWLLQVPIQSGKNRGQTTLYGRPGTLTGVS